MSAPSDLHAKTTLDRVFDTAAALFWEKGYTAATTREIAARAGIQQASLYHHFASKEDLLYKLGVASLEQLNAAVREATAHVEDPVERVEAFVSAHLATLLHDQIRHVTVLTELHALSAARRDEILALRRGYARFVQEMLRVAQDAGRLRADVPAEYLQLALLNMLNWVVFWYRNNPEVRLEEIAHSFAAIFLRGAVAESGRPARLAFLWPAAPPCAETDEAQETKAATRDRMLAAAAELFASKGYAATSTREIAAELGIRKASLYSHIDSKDDLLYAICQWSAERLDAQVRRALAGATTPLDRVRCMIRAHIESLLGEHTKHLAAISEAHLLSPERQLSILALRDRHERLVRGAIDAAMQSGALRADIPAHYMSLALLGLMNRTAVWYRPGGKLDPSQLSALFAELFLHGASAETAET